MIEIIKKVFTILVNTKHLRFLLGLFFIAIAMTGAIEILQGDLKLYAYDRTSSTNKYIALINLSPIYYSACLFAGCWLLFGNEKIENE